MFGLLLICCFVCFRFFFLSLYFLLCCFVGGGKVKPARTDCTACSVTVFFFTAESVRRVPVVLTNPFRTPVPFWVQITRDQTGLPPNRDCGTEGVKRRFWCDLCVAIHNARGFFFRSPVISSRITTLCS